MHGRPRQPKGVAVDPVKKAAKDKKLQQYRALSNGVLHSIELENFDNASLKQSAALLQKSADIYTVWNYRRRATASVLQGCEGQEKAKLAAAVELQVVEAALLENPKAYSAWYHRLWVMRKGHIDPNEELKQVDRFLEMDSRNFHAWRYRREIIKLAGTAPEDELEYAQKLINKNFSNFSAWHARMSTLKDMHAARHPLSFDDLLAGKSEVSEPRALTVPAEVLEQEYDLVQQAFFTDPEDQSAYVYHQWLLQSSVAHYKAALGTVAEETAKKELRKVLAREKERCQELLDIEADRNRCKWPLLTLARIHGLSQSAGFCSVPSTQIRELYLELSRVDPLRQGYYLDAATPVAP